MNDEDEYLKRCRELSLKIHFDETNKTVHASPAYIKLLTYAENLKNQEAYLLARLKEADENRIPEELFDGFSVLKNINENAVEEPFPADHINEVLAAVVRMIRERLGQ